MFTVFIRYDDYQAIIGDVQQFRMELYKSFISMEIDRRKLTVN